MRFLLDLGLSPVLAVTLCDAGHDAVHLRDEGLQCPPDPAIVLKAREEDRTILTHDLDFSDLRAASEAAPPSVVIFRLREMRSGSVERHLRAVISSAKDALSEGAIISVSEGRMRIRRLPIGRD